jgi:hypothetical protein
MSIVAPNEAEREIIADILAAHDLALRLYVNDRTPAKPDTAASYTEASFPGYAARVLTAADWTINTAEPPVAQAPEQAFQQTADAVEQLVYGWYITRADNGKIRWAERFPADGPQPSPFKMSRAGDQITLVPTFFLRSVAA